MKVLITGSNGFIGQWLCETLDHQQIDWVGVDWKASGDVRNHSIDVRNREGILKVFEEEQPDAVVHLAARCDLNGKSLEDYDANISGVQNICDAVAATKSVRRAIYTSSQLVCKVGYVPNGDQDYCADTIYGKSKVRTEEVVRASNGGGIAWCLARPTTVWGPRMNEHYTNLFRHIQNGHYFHSGGGKLYKSYAYAENIAYQYWKLLTVPEDMINQRTLYLADYEPLSLRDYVDLIADSMHVRRPVTVPLPFARLIALGGDIMNGMGVSFPFNSFRLRNIRTEYIFDMKETKSICGPLPKNFEEGVRESVDWYVKSYGDALVRVS